MEKIKETDLEDCPERFELKTRVFENLEKVMTFQTLLLLVFGYLIISLPLYFANSGIVETVCQPVCEDKGFDLVPSAEWIFVDGTVCTCYHSNLRYSARILVKNGSKDFLEVWHDAYDK